MQAIIELYFTPGGVLVLVMVVGDWFRIAQVSHMPFWEGQFVFVKHILEGGRLFGPYTSIFTVFFRFPTSILLTFTRGAGIIPLPFPHHHPRDFTFSMCAWIKW